MARIIQIHPQSPQPRLVQQVVDLLKLSNSGGHSNFEQTGVIAYPTSSGYALGCALSNLKGAEKIRQIRDLQEKQDFTLMCKDISQASTYAKIDDKRFRLIKSLENGKFTFLLPAKPELPRKTNSKRGTVGIRITAENAVAEILDLLEEPILSTSLLVPNKDGVEHGHQIHHGFSKGLELQSFSNAWEINEAIGNLIDVIVELVDDSGDFELNTNPTTVLDLTDDEYEIVRQGSGEIEGSL
jgi:tRNA threonylcarbamoyl adenosine modification protein (Sua5/YciO/YrdC/YwlC family)